MVIYCYVLDTGLASTNNINFYVLKHNKIF